MATAPAAHSGQPSGGPQQVERKREMQKVHAPEQWAWKSVGHTLSGVLLAIEPKEVKG